MTYSGTIWPLSLVDVPLAPGFDYIRYNNLTTESAVAAHAGRYADAKRMLLDAGNLLDAQIEIGRQQFDDLRDRGAE